MKEGDAQRSRTFDAWIAAHGAIVARTARAFARTSGGADCEDLEQEILLAIWRAIPAFRGGSSVATYLYRVAHNAALTWRRAERGREVREQRSVAELSRQPAAPATTVPVPESDEAVLLERLYGAIRELPPVDRSLMLLSLDGVSYEEMAAIHGLSVNLVGVRLHRARRLLATKLQGEER